MSATGPPIDRVAVPGLPPEAAAAAGGPPGGITADAVWKRLCALQGDLAHFRAAQDAVAGELRGMRGTLDAILEAIRTNNDTTEAGGRRVERGLEELAKNRRAMGQAIGRFRESAEPLAAFARALPDLVPALEALAPLLEQRNAVDVLLRQVLERVLERVPDAGG